MGTLICTIEMDKKDGLTVTIRNDDGNVTQTIKMNGTTIELKVVDAQATSTITQSAAKVSVACKQFEVKAEETVFVSSGKTSTYESGTDMTLKSDTQIAATGQNAIALTGGTTSKLELAAAAAKLSGTNVDLTGQAQLSGKAPTVELKSDGILNLESSGMATLKGSLTSVKGSLVNVG